MFLKLYFKIDAGTLQKNTPEEDNKTKQQTTLGLSHSGSHSLIIPVGFQLNSKASFQAFLEAGAGFSRKSADKRHLSWQAKVAAMSRNEIRSVLSDSAKTLPSCFSSQVMALQNIRRFSLIQTSLWLGIAC